MKDSPYLKTLALDDLHLQTTIGKGAFSTVYHATLNGVPVAVKVFETQNSDFLANEPVEAFVGSTIVHPNLVQSYAHRTCDSHQIPLGYEYSDGDEQGKFFASDVSDLFDFVELTRRSATTCSSRLDHNFSAVGCVPMCDQRKCLLLRGTVMVNVEPSPKTEVMHLQSCMILLPFQSARESKKSKAVCLRQLHL